MFTHVGLQTSIKHYRDDIVERLRKYCRDLTQDEFASNAPSARLEYAQESEPVHEEGEPTIIIPASTQGLPHKVSILASNISAVSDSVLEATANTGFEKYISGKIAFEDVCSSAIRTAQSRSRFRTGAP